MASNQNVVNIVVTLVVLSSLLLLWPLILISKILGRAKRSLFREKLAGKVVLITGASSGIGEYLAYEYARRGARLALVARREDLLRQVANKARIVGSPDVIVIRADISKSEDCKRFVDEALLSGMAHSGLYVTVNHLVNNAGIAQVGFFEDCTDISDFNKLMDINFWGNVRTTHVALPYLRKSKGRIVVISSALGWYPKPITLFYNASKAAVTAFFETLSVEFGSDIGITIVTPGAVDSEMTRGNYREEAQMENTPIMPTEDCVKSIVDSVCRGDQYLTEPFWMRIVYLLQLICPELMNWINHQQVAAKRKAA